MRSIGGAGLRSGDPNDAPRISMRPRLGQKKKKKKADYVDIFRALVLQARSRQIRLIIAGPDADLTLSRVFSAHGGSANRSRQYVHFRAPRQRPMLTAATAMALLYRPLRTPPGRGGGGGGGVTTRKRNRLLHRKGVPWNFRQAPTKNPNGTPTDGRRQGKSGGARPSDLNFETKPEKKKRAHVGALPDWRRPAPARCRGAKGSQRRRPSVFNFPTLGCGSCATVRLVEGGQDDTRCSWANLLGGWIRGDDIFRIQAHGAPAAVMLRMRFCGGQMSEDIKMGRQAIIDHCRRRG